MNKLENIILYNYNNNIDNMNNYYNYFKNYNIDILAIRSDARSGILKYNNNKVYFYILNNKIELEWS